MPYNLYRIPFNRKLKPIYLIALLIIICTSCSNYKYWDISKFNINNTALADNEEIQILYTSRGPNNNKDKEYYIHVIAISLKTGDTVNILTTIDNGFTRDDKNKIFNFFNKDNVAAQIAQLDEESFKNLKHVNELKKQEKKKITKVARNPDFDIIADNTYPTIIGIIGSMTNTK